MDEQVDQPIEQPLSALEQAVGRIASNVEALANDWAKTASNGDVHERARLLRAILGTVRDGTELSPAESARLVDLVVGEARQPAGLFDQLTDLQRLLVRALLRELHGTAPAAIEEGLERLTRLFGAAQVGVANKLCRERIENLHRLVHTDPLTGLFNRRHLGPELKRFVSLEQRYGVPFAVLVLDVDRLKQINDVYGHGVGDAALTDLAHVLQSQSRENDIAFRLGGDEFCLLAPHLTFVEAIDLAGRLSTAVEEVAFPGGRLSASFGVAVCPDHGREAGALFAAADRAMYSAKTKRQGVNIATPISG